MTKKIALVTTTIYVPKALDAYMENIRLHGHSSEVLVVVSGDRKTPKEAGPFLLDSAGRHGVEAVFLDCDDQDRFLEGFPELKRNLPWNSIQRRNVALLYAYTHNAQVVITIDDDNFFVSGQDFVGQHCEALSVGSKGVPIVTSSSGWYNICEALREKRGIPFYHRGYPLEQRWPEHEPVVFRRKDGIHPSAPESRRVVVNAGLWLGDPDVDAVTRLANSIEATQFVFDESFGLERGTYSPFNSQNTALARDVIPAYCLSWLVGRHDDIWTSYLVRSIADHLGHLVLYGTPIVRQERNPHNYFNDHEKERQGLEYVYQFTAWLRGIKFTGASYQECVVEAVEAIKALLAASSDEKMKAFVKGWVDTFEIWIATFNRINNK